MQPEDAALLQPQILSNQPTHTSVQPSSPMDQQFAAEKPVSMEL